MSLFQDIKNRKEKIAVTGLGYVGMPLAVAFAACADVIGFDLNAKKIEQYQNGIDPTQEVGDEAVKEARIDFTCDSGAAFRGKISHCGSANAYQSGPYTQPFTGGRGKQNRRETFDKGLHCCV